MPRYKICDDWGVVERIYATCPCCKKDFEQDGIYLCEGDILRCPKCKKRFKLGQEG